MANFRRGEIEAEFNHHTYILCLTLGALAELESALHVDNLIAVIERFQNQSFSARDLTYIIYYGLRGGGNNISYDDVMCMTTDGALPQFLIIATSLLKATFAQDDDHSANPL
jgi:Phage tail tube protein, GTA-gp10